MDYRLIVGTIAYCQGISSWCCHKIGCCAVPQLEKTWLIKERRDYTSEVETDLSEQSGEEMCQVKSVLEVQYKLFP